MERDKEGFLYDQRVIDTLVALKGFQTGDEILLQRTHLAEYQLGVEFDGAVGVVNNLDMSEAYASAVVGVTVPTTKGEAVWIERCEIRAWRRPTC